MIWGSGGDRGGQVDDLAGQLESALPAYALRIEGANENLISAPAIGPIVEMTIGPIAWPSKPGSSSVSRMGNVVGKTDSAMFGLYPPG